MNYSDARLIVLTKTPSIGCVKTRLIPVLSAAQACEIHCHLLYQTIKVASQASLCELEVSVLPDCRHPLFHQWQKEFGFLFKLPAR